MDRFGWLKVSFMMVLVGWVGLVSAETVAPSFVAKEATFWLDASALTETAGTGLDAWPDARGGDYPGVTTYTPGQPQVITIAEGPLAGKKAVSFANVPNGANNQDMRFAATHSPRTFFFVTDVDLNQNAILLGGPDGVSSYTRCYVFYRGSNGQYRYGSSGATTAGTYWENGRKIADSFSAVLPTGYQLITFAHSEPSMVRYICSDRLLGEHIGSKRVCEIVAFDRELTDVERSHVEAYLRVKWFGAASVPVAALEMLGKKAQVHFDAAVATSFQYETAGDGTHVSQWNDLSGNDNHFTPTSADALGTVGAVRGKPVYDAGACGSRIDLALASRLTTTRTVFMASEMQRDYYDYWLGDHTAFHYARGANGEYAYGPHNGCYLGKYGKVWENGMAVKDVLKDWPDGPGDLSVFTLETPIDCCWFRLCQDRGATATTGGKKVAEILSFANTFNAHDRAMVEGWLMEKWGPSTAEVDAVIAQAAVHVDATSADQFTYAADQTIDGWKNLGTGGDLYKPANLTIGSNTFVTQPGTYGFSGGVRSFSLGPCGSDIELAFGVLTNIRSVFWVMDIAKSACSFFLADMSGIPGGGNTYNFCRNEMAPWAYAHSGHAHVGFKNGSLACDGAKVMPMTDTPPSGLHVYDLASPVNLTASSLSMDRTCQDGGRHRNGGKTVAELLIFTQDVRGLMRRAIRNRLEARWTKGCAWAGAGDAEWGADKYRVFGADAEVPAAGAAAAGVGFTANAYLTGGTLTLGAGGIFASEGILVEVVAPVAGELGVYGNGGTVKLSAAPAVASIRVGSDATLTLPPYGTASGELVLEDGARIVFDASRIVAGQTAALTVGAVTLRGGGSLLDYVSTSDDAHHVLTVSPDGKTILVDDSTVPFTAVWSGAGDRANVADSANWICQNTKGEVLEGAVPNEFTTVTVEGATSFNLPTGQTLVCKELVLGDVTLTADCDWRGLGTVDVTGKEIDLDGHRLDLAGFTGTGTIGSVVPPAVVLDGTPHSWYDAAGPGLIGSLNLDGKVSYWCSKGSKGIFCGGGSRGASVMYEGKEPSYDTTTFGRPTVDFGAQNNQVDMLWNRTNVRMGFWVAKMNQSMDTFWLGDVGANNYGFCRGALGQYGHPSYSNFKTVWDDGNVVNWGSTVVPADSFRIVCIETSKDTSSNCFATDRDCNGRLGGGRQFSEVILYDHVLSEADRMAVTAYLQRKWAHIGEAPGELHLHVPGGQTIENATVRLTGNMKLVKEGTGTYRSAKAQDNAGGLQIVAGTVQMGLDGRALPLGTGEIVIEANGTFDRNGFCEDPNNNYVLNGGCIVNAKGDIPTYSQMAQLKVTANSALSALSTHGVIQASYKRTRVDLGGNELVVSIGSGKSFYLFNTDMTSGRFAAAGASGWLYIDKTSLRAAETDFDLNCAVNLQVDAEVHDLTWRYGTNEANGACALHVHGTFNPVADYFHNVQLQDGATLDLAAKTLPWSTTSQNTNNGDHFCAFADNARVTVRLAGRGQVKNGAKIVDWAGHPPSNIATLNFVADAASAAAGLRIAKRDDGLYVSRGLVILFK